MPIAMLAEADRDLRQTYREYLARRGFEVAAASPPEVGGFALPPVVKALAKPFPLAAFLEHQAVPGIRPVRAVIEHYRPAQLDHYGRDWGR